MPDGPENDYFATQFATSIVKESGGLDEPYWFGRMVRFLGSSEYVFRNFFGIDYTESQFRAKYDKGEILVDTFDISDVDYTVDPNDPTLATVRMNVTLEATIDGVKKSGEFELVHKVKQGWQAYESELISNE